MLTNRSTMEENSKTMNIVLSNGLRHNGQNYKIIQNYVKHVVQLKNESKTIK